LPGIAAVQQQRARPVGLEPLDQRGKVRESAYLAVLAGGIAEIRARKGIGLCAAWLHTVVRQEMITHQMRRPIQCGPQTDIDPRLAKVDGAQLRVAVRKVQKMHIAKAWQIIKPGGSRLGRACGMRKAHPARGGNTKHLQKLTTADHNNDFLCIE